MNEDIFVIDACSLIEASKRYHLDKKIFENVWNKFAELFESRSINFINRSI